MTHTTSKYVTLLILIVAVVLTACRHDDDDDAVENDAALKTGDKVPAFTLTAQDGSTITAASLRGQAYIINFFDTSCPDCRQELQVLQQLHEKWGDALPLLNVPRSQSTADITAYWNATQLTMPFYTPKEPGLYYRFAQKRIPRTFVVDENGIIRAAFADNPVADFNTLDKLVGKLTPEVPADSVRLVMRLHVPRLGNNPDDYYFHNEYIITYLEAWFFNSDTKKFVTKASTYDLSAFETDWNTEYDITYLYSDLHLPADKYDIFIIANYEHSPDSVATEAELLNLQDTITYYGGIEANIPSRGAVMTSRPTAQLNIDLVPYINSTYAFNVELERVMAKLQIGVKQNTFSLTHGGEKYADINLTNYKLVNMNRCYYLFQHRDSIGELTAQPDFQMPFNFVDYSDKGEQYVIDPHFYQKTEKVTDARLFENLYINWFGSFETIDFASMPSADNFGYAYLLENTSFRSMQLNGYSPGIVFKGAVNPVFVYLYDNTLHVLNKETRPEYWPDRIYLYNYNFYGSLQAINNASGLSLDELATYTDEQLKSYGIKQCCFNMGVYETYYTYWIEHRIANSPAEQMGPMHYGIVRNHFYRITVSGITGIGNSLITPDIMRPNYPNSYTDISVDTD